MTLLRSKQIIIILLLSSKIVTFLFAFEPKGQVFKKVPLEAVESFLKKKSGKEFEIINGEDTLVPINANIVFGLNKKDKKIFVKSFILGGSQKIYQTFSLKKRNIFKRTKDVSLGSYLSLSLNQKLISIQFVGQALQSGNIGDIIRVRISNLARIFKARVLSKNRGAILF